MPKSRKSKAKYNDFQKVKLKIGKKLPKAANATNTSFQSRSIQLKEQLKQPDSGQQPTNKRRQNVTDLLSHCNHYNISVRHDAITGLRDLITSNPDVLTSQLSSILESVSGLCVDKDSAVRHALYRFFKAALPQISTEQVAPFFSLLSAHLCCAMTHIDDEIQVDSLQLLDLCMDNYPKLVVTSNNNLLQNFIDQISKQSNTKSKVGGHGGSSLNNSGRSLLVNPNSKLSSQKYRVQVLNRLHSFLNAVVDVNGVGINKTSAVDADTPPGIIVGKATWHQPISSDHLRPSQSSSFSASRGGGETSGIDLLASGEKLKSVVDVLIPLLLQCWVEFGPAQLSSDLPGNAMSSEALASLASILNVIQLLLRCVDQYDASSDSALMQVMKSKYTNEFVQFFLPYFPYSMHERPQTGKKKQDKSLMLNVPIMSLNLMVCEVMSYFTDDNDSPQSKWMQQIVSYIELSTKASLATDQIQAILRFLDKMFKFSQPDEKEELMDVACSLFAGKHRLSKDRLYLMNFISRQILDDRTYQFLEMASVKKWLSSLPSVLLRSCREANEMSGDVFSIVRKMAALGEEHLLRSLQKECIALIGTVDKLDGQLQADLVDVLFWLPCWRKQELEALAEVCHQHYFEPRHLHRLLICLLHRDNSFLTIYNVGELFGFLLSVAAGRKTADIDSLRDGHATSDQFKCVLQKDSFWKWPKAMEYAKVVCDILGQFQNTHQVSSVVSLSVDSILKDKPVIPLDTVTAFIQLLTAVYLTNGGIVPTQPTPVVNRVVSMTTDAVALSVADQENGNSEEETGDAGLVRDSVLAACRNLLASSPDTVISFSNALLGRMSECRDVKSVYNYVVVLGMINDDGRLRSQMAGHWNHTRAVISKLQDSVPDLDKHGWWSDLKYKHSLLQPKRN